MNYLQLGKKIVITMVVITSHGMLSQHLFAAEADTTATFSGKAASTPLTRNTNKKVQLFQNTGIVRKVDLGERSIIISGNKHYYGVDIKVHTKDSGFSTVSALTQNTLIGFSAVRDANNRRILQEIWVIPKINFNSTPFDM